MTYSHHKHHKTDHTDHHNNDNNTDQTDNNNTDQTGNGTDQTPLLNLDETGADAKITVDVLQDDNVAEAKVWAGTEGPIETALDARVTVGDGLDIGDPGGLLSPIDCVDPGETIAKLLSLTDGASGGNPLLVADVNGPVDTGLVVGDGDPNDALISAEVNLPESAAGLIPDVGNLPADIGDVPVDLGCLGGVLDVV